MVWNPDSYDVAKVDFFSGIKRDADNRKPGFRRTCSSDRTIRGALSEFHIFANHHGNKEVSEQVFGA